MDSKSSGPGRIGAVVQVLGNDGAMAGAGFAVAADVVATCAHVIAAAGGTCDGRVQLVISPPGGRAPGIGPRARGGVAGSGG